MKAPKSEPAPPNVLCGSISGCRRHLQGGIEGLWGAWGALGGTGRPAVPLPGAFSPDFSLKCIKDKKIPIGVTVVVAALLLTIIALAGKRQRAEVPTTQIFSSGENPPAFKSPGTPPALFQRRNARPVHPAPLPSFPAAWKTASGTGRSASTSWRTKRIGTAAPSPAFLWEPIWPPSIAGTSW